MIQPNRVRLTITYAPQRLTFDPQRPRLDIRTPTNRIELTALPNPFEAPTVLAGSAPVLKVSFSL